MTETEYGVGMGKTAPATDRLGELVNAPLWWPYWEDESFTEEDQWEIERHCNKIKENIANEPGMTPYERWKTTKELRIPDRPYVGDIMCNLTVARALDCWSLSIKPGIDMYWYPKLLLKAHFAWNARFNPEVICPYILTYGDTEWGGSSKVKIAPYAAPAWVDPPVKTDADWDRIHVPDVYRDGFYPPYLWMIRKTKQFMKKHGIAGVLPLKGDFCGSSAHGGTVVRGMKNYMMDVKRNPENVHRAAKLDLQYKIPYAKAVLEAGADTMGACNFGAFFGLEAYKKLDIDKYDVAVSKAVGDNFVWMNGFDQTNSLEYQCQTGSMPMGWMNTHETPMEIQRPIAQKYKKIFAMQTNPLNAVKGPPEKIIEDVKRNIDVGAGPGYYLMLNFCDFWSVPEYIDLTIKTAKEYGAEVYKKLGK